MARKTFTIDDGENNSDIVRLNAFERPVAFITGSDTTVADDVYIMIGESSAAMLTAYDSNGAAVCFPYQSSVRTIFDNTLMGGGAYYQLSLRYADGSSALQSGNSATIYMEVREYNW